MDSSASRIVSNLQSRDSRTDRNKKKYEKRLRKSSQKQSEWRTQTQETKIYIKKRGKIIYINISVDKWNEWLKILPRHDYLEET